MLKRIIDDSYRILVVKNFKPLRHVSFTFMNVMNLEDFSLIFGHYTYLVSVEEISGYRPSSYAPLYHFWSATPHRYLRLITMVIAEKMIVKLSSPWWWWCKSISVATALSLSWWNQYCWVYWRMRWWWRSIFGNNGRGFNSCSRYHENALVMREFRYLLLESHITRDLA